MPLLTVYIWEFVKTRNTHQTHHRWFDFCWHLELSWQWEKDNVWNRMSPSFKTWNL